MLILGGASLVFFIFLPYLGALLLGGTFGIIFYPLYKKVLVLMGDRSSLASIAVLLLVFTLLLVPTLLFGVQIFQESTELYGTLASSGDAPEVLGSFINSLEDRIQTFVPGLEIDLNAYSQRVAQWVVQNISTVFSGIAEFLVTLLLGMFAFYYFLKDGKKLREYIVKISPLSDEHDREILRRLAATVNSVIKGSMAIALIQGVLTGLGFFIFGIPNPALWGGVAFIAALIPSVGTALVLVPGIVYLFFIGNGFAALGLLIWGMIAVGLADNMLGPKLMQKGGIELHPFFILLSVLGGISLFGIAGLMVGPLAISFLATVVHVYSQELKLAS